MYVWVMIRYNLLIGTQHVPGYTGRDSTSESGSYEYFQARILDEDNTVTIYTLKLE